MSSLAHAVDRLSRGWVVLLLGIFFLLFVATLLPRAAETNASYSQGAGSPDTSFLYSAERLYDMAQAYGVEGRRAYVRARLTYDLAFPLIYGSFYATAIAYTLRKAWPRQPRPWGWSVLPLWAAAADLVENAAVVGVMLLYPDPSILLAGLAAFATPIKWLLVGVAIFLTIFGSLAWAAAALRRRR